MKALAGALLLAGILVSPAAPAVAAETANSEFVIIRQGDVVSDDLYAGAIRIIVEGVIEGDLIAFAAEEVVIDGTVTGSVIVVSPRVRVDGSVEGSLRVVANSVEVDGRIGGDLVVAGLDVRLAESSTVEGEVLAWVLAMRALGSAGGLGGSQRTLDLAGSVESDVDVSVARLRIVDELRVGGDLGFRSESEASGLEQASVGGVIVEKSPLPPNIRVRALGLFARFLAILFLTIAALAVAWGWPQRTERAIEEVQRSPIRAWGSGAIVVLSPLILAGVAALTLALGPAAASLPLLAIFAPLILAAIGLVAALSLFAGVPVVGWLGARLFVRLSVYGAILAGSLITGLLWLLPVLGWVVPLIILPLGLGTWFRGLGRGTFERTDLSEGSPSG